MAKFEDAVEFVLEQEGGYSNHPNDTGGETYKGVSRKNFPLWDGWNIIDAVKDEYPRNVWLSIWAKDNRLQALVKEWYRDEFWKKIMGDFINSQKVATNVFDFAVNAGVVQATKVAQRILGVKDDGVFGGKTLAALNNQNADTFVDKYVNARIKFYESLVAKRPANAVFLKGWLARAERAREYEFEA